MMDAKTILLEALESRWKKFRLELKTCKKDFSEEAVHDLRVATRRLLAVFDLLRAITPHKRIQKIRSALKDQLDSLDDLRDVQVLLADVSEFMKDVPDLKPFREHLMTEEKNLLRFTNKRLKAHKIKDLSKRVEKIHVMVQELPEVNLAEQTVAAVDDAFARVIRSYSVMDLENIASIHKLRVAFKKFRYSIEIVQPLLENFPSANFERMHDYQSKMGDIQDLEIASYRLADLDASASLPGLEVVSAHYASRLRAAILKFVEDKGEALVFWRSSPEQSFPWENNS